VGLYFSSVSGKANDYADGSEKRFNARAYRVMFLANIVVGQAYKTEEGFIHTPCPPAGYDSVMGEVSISSILTVLLTTCHDAMCSVLENSTPACDNRVICCSDTAASQGTCCVLDSNFV
jgi:hypothetical protein